MRLYITNLLKINNLMSKNTSVRCYARWTHRRPVKVLTSEEFELQEQAYKKNQGLPKTNTSDNVIELDPSHIQDFNERNIRKITNEHTQKIKSKQKAELFDLGRLDAETHFQKYEEKKPVQASKKNVQYTKEVVSKTTFDEDGNLVFTKMKDNDPRIGTLMLMVKSKKLRKRKELVLLEGIRLIKDALQSGCTLQYLLFSRKSSVDLIRDLLPKENIEVYKMAYRDIQMWSDLTTCPGIMGIFKTPTTENICSQKKTLPLTIICDNIREPGNLGAILRSSVAVGCEKVILTKGCVDLWDTKVLRSSTGAHFKYPIHTNMEWDKIAELLPSCGAVFLADNNIITSEDTTNKNLQDLCVNVPVVPYYAVTFPNCKSIVLVVGGETFGLSEYAYKFASENNGTRLNIPLENNVESLNTGIALGIIVFELKRQFLLSK